MNCTRCQTKLVPHRTRLHCPQCGDSFAIETHVPEMYPTLREQPETSVEQRLLIAEIKITNLEQELKSLRSELLG